MRSTKQKSEKLQLNSVHGPAGGREGKRKKINFFNYFMNHREEKRIFNARTLLLFPSRDIQLLKSLLQPTNFHTNQADPAKHDKKNVMRKSLKNGHFMNNINTKKK